MLKCLNVVFKGCDILFSYNGVNNDADICVIK